MVSIFVLDDDKGFSNPLQAGRQRRVDLGPALGTM
jgi:hypothetical protein